MANQHGDFIWYELMSPDPDASEVFYRGLIGWSVEPGDPTGQVDYRLFRSDSAHVGGLLGLTPEDCAEGARPTWVGYIGVEDVDAATADLVAQGGQVVMAPMTMEGVGRMAMLRDPQGAAIYLMRGASDAPSEAFAQDAPRVGHCAWHELRTPDPSAALATYTACFGWEIADSMDMGPMGSYDMLRNPPHETLLGAMMRQPDPEARAMWLFYFRVADIDVAAAYITAQGGTVLMGPQEIPGGEFMINATDPQGALLALVGTRAG